MSLIGTRVHVNTVGASTNTQLGVFNNIGNGRVSTVSNQRDFIEIDA
jgi:hypothetical protein